MTSLSSFGSLGSRRWRSRSVELLLPALEGGELGGEGLVLAGQLTGGDDVTFDGPQGAHGLDDRTQLGVAPAQRAGLALVGVHRRVGQLTLEVGVLLEKVLVHEISGLQVGAVST